MVKAARVQRARVSALRSTVERQVAVHGDFCPERDARGRRIRTAKREVERALRSREQLQASIRTADAAAGHAIRRLLDEGLTAVDAAILVRLSRSQVKRLLRVTAGPSQPRTGRSSTERIFGGASDGADADRDKQHRSSQRSDRRKPLMLLSHAVVLAEARSCLAALADNASSVEASLDYERVLLQLDWLHGGTVPPITVVPSGHRDVLYRVASAAIRNLEKHSIDRLDLEICAAMLDAAWEQDEPS